MKIKSILLFILLNNFILNGQNINFPCDSNFKFHIQNWSDKSINIIYDSLNSIDFSNEDFELRIWHHSFGQQGIGYNVFILRHFIEDNKWKAFFYVGYKELSKHKSFSEYFTDNELKNISSKKWKQFWNTLVVHQILTIQPLSRDSLSIVSNGSYLEISHDSYYTFELIKKDCKRGFAFSKGTASTTPFKDIPEFVSLNLIVSKINEQLYQSLKK